ncbi:RNA polymerase I associated factor, A49-like protein [Annulohypoxylon maeteangense]|uniref:RNA polymerase I associated factor, A49-like protein n=1 Tax=Annulohypoxylon maeteangense TaxID=1927788 RepID=UPI0020088C88|nr:RNA polymerase I associated factor, A49-like protein [Annulohypoxylon maeteangense]KAI0887486.1 RNA polymerase I associated factor, A49-like protein [Annulohypoxylon maeteangense]
MAEHKEKKRKRGEDGSQRPKKKVAVQTPSQSQSNFVRVSSVQTAKTCPPVIATSPGLCLQDSMKFQAYTTPQSTSSKRSKKSDSRTSSLLLHSSSHGKLDYTAKEEGPGGRESHLKHYIGVFDPQTGKLAVVEAKKMAVRGVVRSQKPPEDVTEREATQTMLELRNNLGEAFGTKKAKKALAAITENAIAPEKAIADAGGDPQKLSSASKALMESINDVTIGMASKEDLQAQADLAKPIPPGNYDAEEIQDVYTPEGLIGGDILNAIPVRDWQEQLKKGLNKTMTSSFVASRLVPVGEGPNPVHRLRALRYLDLLLKFVKNAKPGKERGTKRIPPRDKLRELLNPAPEPVVESIRRKFSSNGEMRKFHTDLVYTYCCALASILSNYSFDTSRIRFDLGLDEKQFGQYFREIGGKVKIEKGAEKGTHVQVASLALPLVFPKVRYQRPRGR